MAQLFFYRAEAAKMQKSQSTSKLYFSVAIVLIATLTPGNGKIAGNLLDKVVHFGLFFFVAWNVLNYFHQATKQTEMLLWVVIMGLVTEMLQQWIPGRNTDLYDGLANSIGILCAYYFYKNRRTQKK